MLGVVGSNSTIFKLEPTTPDTSQQGGQTRATGCAQQCCDMLRCNVAIVWPGLNAFHHSLYYFRRNVFQNFVVVINCGVPQIESNKTEHSQQSNPSDRHRHRDNFTER